MGKTQRERELACAYKNRVITGGVCAVRNSATGRVLLLPCANPEAQGNRFAFSVSTGTPLHPSMAEDWLTHGADCFSFAVLETLEKRPEQTDRQFQQELDLLGEIWRERLAAEGAGFYT